MITLFKKKSFLWYIIAAVSFVAIVFITVDTVVSISEKIFVDDISPITKVIQLQKNGDYIFSAKGNATTVSIALKNLRKYIPFFHEFTSNDLIPFSVDVSNEKSSNNANINMENTGHIFIRYTLKEIENKNAPQKWIYLRVYERGYKPRYMPEFEYSPGTIHSSFELNDINWEEYKGGRENDTYFRGIKDDVIFEISGVYFSPDQIRQYLNTFLNTARK